MKVIKFGAVWCPGCLVMRPLWEKLEAENPWLETEYFDFDKDKEAVTEFGIDSKLPVFIFQDKLGAEIVRLQGERSKSELLDLINKHKEA